jgi:hypothetical protein
MAIRSRSLSAKTRACPARVSGRIFRLLRTYSTRWTGSPSRRLISPIVSAAGMGETTTLLPNEAWPDARCSVHRIDHQALLIKARRVDSPGERLIRGGERADRGSRRILRLSVTAKFRFQSHRRRSGFTITPDDLPSWLRDWRVPQLRQYGRGVKGGGVRLHRDGGEPKVD